MGIRNCQGRWSVAITRGMGRTVWGMDSKAASGGRGSGRGELGKQLCSLFLISRALQTRSQQQFRDLPLPASTYPFSVISPS